mmetsp:Transcript_30246/g.76847  ORF Transcript_30246/g.76847 Transcript_30246/m.76847 type:complete len:212 (+) Transcript_30246:520-1155(+)
MCCEPFALWMNLTGSLILLTAIRPVVMACRSRARSRCVASRRPSDSSQRSASCTSAAAPSLGGVIVAWTTMEPDDNASVMFSGRTPDPAWAAIACFVAVVNDACRLGLAWRSAKSMLRTVMVMATFARPPPRRPSSAPRLSALRRASPFVRARSWAPGGTDALRFSLLGERGMTYSTSDDGLYVSSMRRIASNCCAPFASFCSVPFTTVGL